MPTFEIAMTLTVEAESIVQAHGAAVAFERTREAFGTTVWGKLKWLYVGLSPALRTSIADAERRLTELAETVPPGELPQAGLDVEDERDRRAMFGGTVVEVEDWGEDA